MKRHFHLKRRWQKVAIKNCPECNRSNFLREILYGLPESPLDESRYSIGGGCISEKDPTITCLGCGWEVEFINNIEAIGQL